MFRKVVNFGEFQNTWIVYLLKLFVMNVIQEIWRNYLDYIVEFNWVQRAIISIVLACIILAAGAATFFLILGLA